MDNGPKMPLLRDGTEAAQIRQTETPFTNSTLKGPKDTDVGDLACELAIDPRTETIVTVSAWQPTAQQRAWLAAGAHLRMSVWQHPIPPLALAVESPFCSFCDSPTIFVKSEQAFACATRDCMAYGRPWNPDGGMILSAEGVKPERDPADEGGNDDEPADDTP